VLASTFVGIQGGFKWNMRKKLTMQRGTLATSGSEATRLQNLVMAATPSNIPSSMLNIKRVKISLKLAIR